MDFAASDFAFSATIKLADMPKCRANATFPGVADLAVNSRNFNSYTECVNVAKAFMDDVVKDANSQNTIELTVSAEVNPVHSGVETRSRDWADDELARLWIFDKSQEGSKSIHAIGQARIFALEKGASILAN